MIMICLAHSTSIYKIKSKHNTGVLVQSWFGLEAETDKNVLQSSPDGANCYM